MFKWAKKIFFFFLKYLIFCIEKLHESSNFKIQCKYIEPLVKSLCWQLLWYNIWHHVVLSKELDATFMSESSVVST